MVLTNTFLHLECIKHEFFKNRYLKKKNLEILLIEFYQQFQSVDYVKNVLANGIKFIC